MKHHALLFIFVVSLILGLSMASTPSFADKYKVEDGDLLKYGYRLYVNGTNVETRTEENPIQIAIRKTSFEPPGLYDYLIGMKNGEIKPNIVIPPEDGYTDGRYPDQALTFLDLQVYSINGYSYTEITTNTSPRSFGYWILTIGGGILGTAGTIFLIYGGYRIYPKIFGKRCLNCGQPAVGTCKTCGKAFCNTCYSTGCPNCKGRSLVRFK